MSRGKILRFLLLNRTESEAGDFDGQGSRKSENFFVCLLQERNLRLVWMFLFLGYDCGVSVSWKRQTHCFVYKGVMDRQSEQRGVLKDGMVADI